MKQKTLSWEREALWDKPNSNKLEYIYYEKDVKQFIKEILDIIEKIKKGYEETKVEYRTTLEEEIIEDLAYMLLTIKQKAGDDLI